MHQKPTRSATRSSGGSRLRLGAREAAATLDVHGWEATVLQHIVVLGSCDTGYGRDASCVWPNPVLCRALVCGKQVLPAVAYVRNGLISEPIRVEIVFSQLAFARNSHRATGDAAGRFRYSSAQGHCIPFHSMRKQLPLDSKCAVNKGYSTVTRFAYPDMPMFCRFHW